MAPMLRYGGAVGRRSRVSQVFQHEAIVMVRFESMVDRNVKDLIKLGDDVRALLLAVRPGEVDEKTGAQPGPRWPRRWLVGQPESRWLDVKKQPRALGTPAW